LLKDHVFQFLLHSIPYPDNLLSQAEIPSVGHLSTRLRVSKNMSSISDFKYLLNIHALVIGKDK